MKNEDGILSVDFLAGFTIFILALILVINFVPGILIGINSEGIDYDAVAYRTAVILVEDPGAPEVWEQTDNDHKDQIYRLGLALSPQSPGVLSRYKISKFFNEPAYFDFTVDEYERKVIFADMPYAPYAYNISLAIDGASSLSKGSPVPEYSYGYIRRLVKVKEGSSAVIDMTYLDMANPGFTTGRMNATAGNFTQNTSFTVQFDYDELIDLSLADAYRIDPRRDPVTITIDNFPASIGNTSDVQNITFTNVRFFKTGLEIPMNYSEWNNNSYRLYDMKEGTATWIPHTLNDTFVVYDIDPGILNTSRFKLEFNPAMPYSGNKDVIFGINFAFAYNFTNSTHAEGHRYIEGVFPYDYANANQPALRPGVLEVAIW